MDVMIKGIEDCNELSCDHETPQICSVATILDSDGVSFFEVESGGTGSCTQVNEWMELEFDTSIVDYSVAGTVALGFASGTIFLDWGDGSAIEHIKDITGVSDVRLTHVYSTIGNYTVKIKGNVEFLWISRDGDKLVNLKNWGLLQESSLNAAFFGCSNMIITATDSMHIGTYDGRNAFLNCASLNLFPLKVITSTMGITTSMFSGTNFDDGSAIADLGYVKPYQWGC